MSEVSFSTYSSSEKPKILILGSKDQLSLSLDHFIKTQGLDSVIKNEIPPENWYKIIWLKKDLNNEDRKTLQDLEKQNTPLLCFLPISSFKKIDEESQKNNLKKFINRLNSLSNYRLVLTQDFICEGFISKDWKEVIGFLRDGKVFDPELEITPTITENLKQIFEPLIFSPIRSEIWLLKSGFVESNVFFEKLQQQLGFVGKQVEISKSRIFNSDEISIKVDKEIRLELNLDDAVKNLVFIFNKNKNLVRKPEAEVSNTSPNPKAKIPTSSAGGLNPKSHPRGDQPLAENLKIQSSKLNLGYKISDSGLKTPFKQPNIEDKTKDLNKKEDLSNIELELEKELKSLFKEDRVEKKLKKVEKKAKKAKKIIKKQRKRKSLFFFSFFILGLTSGIFLLFVLFKTNLYFLNLKTQNFVEKVDEVSRDDKELNRKKQELSLLNKLLLAQKNIYSSVLPQNWFESVVKKTNIAASLLDFSDDKYQGSLAYEQLLRSIISANKSGTDVEKEIQSLYLSSEEQYEILSQTQLRFTNDLDSEQDKTLKTISVKRKELEKQLKIIENLPKIIGTREIKTYALLLLNNLELQASGGKIESVALISFKNGGVSNVQVFDAYQINEMNKGLREAPESMSLVLKKNEFGVSENTWFFDYSQGAKNISQDLERIFSQKIDGVLAINTLTVKSILEQTGDLEIDSLNETINSKNIFEKIYLHASVDLNEKLKQKSFFSQMFQALLETKNEKNIIKIISTIGQNLESEQAYLYLDGNQLEEFSWDGNFEKPDCQQIFQGECQLDSFLQVETNIGGNFTNNFVEREIEHNVSLLNKSVQHNRRVLITSEATSNAWPSGDYRAFLRLISDSDMRVNSVLVNGKSLQGEDLYQYKENGKNVIGLFIDVPPQKSAEIVYQFSIPLTSNKAYAIFEQKQAGTTADAFLAKISYPNSLSPTLIAPQAQVEDNQLVFSLLKNQDLLITVKFD